MIMIINLMCRNFLTSIIPDHTTNRTNPLINLTLSTQINRQTHAINLIREPASYTGNTSSLHPIEDHWQ